MCMNDRIFIDIFPEIKCHVPETICNFKILIEKSLFFNWLQFLPKFLCYTCNGTDLTIWDF